MGWFRHGPKLSLVVVVYDMGREAPRTLRSLSIPYQTGISADDYEVIVMDNGSPTPLSESVVREFGPQFRYHYVQHALPSPAAALNQGVALARGKYVGLFIDGARLTSPGLLTRALQAFELYKDPIVATLAWHLGPELQQKSVQKGYDKIGEDRLLESIGWPQDGYRLFEISVLAASSYKGYAAAPSESNALFLERRTYKKLGGFDPAFDLPGGGLLNLDFFIRCLERDSPLVMLFGEGTFHQLHGGASTGTPVDRFPQWAAQYARIRGKEWKHPEKPMRYLGAPTHPSLQAAYDALPR